MIRKFLILLTLAFAFILPGAASADTWYYGTNGSDHITGGYDADHMLGYNSGDYLNGMQQVDELKGGYGDDKLYGGTSTDWLYGMNDDDELVGEAHEDWLFGGYQNDRIISWHDYRRDFVDGGPGWDTCYVDDWDEVHDCEATYKGW